MPSSVTAQKEEPSVEHLPREVLCGDLHTSSVKETPHLTDDEVEVQTSEQYARDALAASQVGLRTTEEMASQLPRA